MDPDVEGPTALCVTDPAARDAHRWASDVPGGPQAHAVVSAHDEARYWCKRCDVRDVCLAFALAAEGKTDERARDGVYGGVGPMGRAVLAGRGPKDKAPPKELDPISCGTCGETFTPGSASARYCSTRCRKTVIYRYQGIRRKQKRAEARAARAS